MARAGVPGPMMTPTYKKFKTAVLQGGSPRVGEPTTRGSRQDGHGNWKHSVGWGLLGAAHRDRLCFRGRREYSRVSGSVGRTALCKHQTTQVQRRHSVANFTSSFLRSSARGPSRPEMLPWSSLPQARVF